MHTVRLRLALAFALAAPAGPLLQAQGVTANVSGFVVDSSGAVVPAATVTITNIDTSWPREVTTRADGRFEFVAVLAGTYDVRASLRGFKAKEPQTVSVGSTDRVELSPLVLEAGDIQETISVATTSDLVQTTTAARGSRITQDNLDNISLKGRDALGTIKLLAGIVDTNAREAPTWSLLSGLSINGRTNVNLAYDGVSNKLPGNTGNIAAPSVDSIAEIRVQSANFQAEYGRSSGASITVITRSGSKDFRGSAAFYKRDAALNGNEYQRKQQCWQGDRLSCEAAMYRFDNVAWTLSGPILLPSTDFNRQRNRLFFFWSQDLLARTDPGTLNLRRMPTARERQGDFSQTFDSTGKGLVFIRDPQRDAVCNARTGGPGCFTNNVIPPDRIDPTGQALLKLFPLPNATDSSGTNQYNYAYQMVNDWPRNDQVLRVDWNVGSRTTVYGRLQFGYEKRAGPVAPFGFGGGWPQMPSRFDTDAASYVTTLLHTINPTTFVEATAGVNWGYQGASALSQAALDANNRDKVLPGMPQFFPQANPLNLLPNATFNGGITAGGAASLGLFQYERRFPFYGYMTVWDFSNSLTKVWKTHNIKTGIFVEHSTRPAQQRSAYNGTFSFNNDTGQSGNTNVGFANALLGTVTSFQQADKRPIGHGQFVNTEFYAQDNWRMSRSLTIDAGVRFYYLTPTRSHGDRVAQFEPDVFDPVAAPLLYLPTVVAGSRRALNPVTNDSSLPALYIGRPILGTGNLYNGTRLYDGTPQQRSPFAVAPRLGFAWNVTGDGRTAIRGGAGAFYDRYAENDILELTELPPLVRTYTANYTTIAELTSTRNDPTTSAMRRIQEFVPPVVYNWSAGVQRDVGWNLVIDAAYVGNAARHQSITRELNGRPYGYRFQASSLDPTNVLGGVTQPLTDDLLRPYRGYASISQREFTGYADYHSLQVSATRRRRADGLTFGAAYTYEIVNKSLGAIDPFLADNRARNYNSVGRRPHTLTIHYSWLVPGARRSSAALVRAIVNGWQLSGVTSVLSGARGAFTYSYSSVPTGALIDNGSIGGGPNRPRIVCDPSLPRSRRTFERQFRTECIAAPDDPYHFGTSRGDEFHGPGYINWDISVFKHIPMGGSRRLQLRVELYNAFNTYQWTTVNTNAEFNFTTGALSNPGVFGTLTGATNSARRIQLAARFTF
jgi:carboxypeptidase family protein